MINCEFCNKEFTTKGTLQTHQKSAKYCLELQGKSSNDEYVCEFCNKTFNIKSSLIRHIVSCSKKLNNEIMETEKTNEELQKEVLELKKKLEFSNQKLNLQDEYISKLEAKIEKLEDTIIGIAESKNELLNTDSNEIQIQELTKKYGKKQQKRQQVKEPNVIYILTTKPLKEQRRYIFGKSKNLTNRLSTYNKTDEHEIIYYQGCRTEGNMDTVEKMVLNKLEQYREVENRDRFILPEDKEIDFFIDIIKRNIEFILEN
jgi:uncharacterized Zn-finger protein